MFYLKIISIFLFLLFPQLSTAQDELKLAGIFNHNMVLQRNSEVAIWGMAEAKAEVKLKVSWSKKVQTVLAGADGKWKMMVKTPKAGENYSLNVTSGSSKVTIENIGSGEVWICSGQSNMQWKMRGFGVDQFKEDVQKSNKPKIRFCTIQQRIGLVEQDDLPQVRWNVCNPKSVLGFSAVGYFFGSKLHEELNVPIGLISCNWGGSAIEGWISSDILREEMSEYSQKTKNYKEWQKKSETYTNRGKPKGLNQSSPAVLYNGMLKPLISFGIKGVVWYQGESNVDAPAQYAKLFPLMIEDWRKQWGRGDFPFYYVQIAPWVYKQNPISAAYLREAQLKALSTSNTGMVVTMDVGDVGNIHPKRKKPVGERLARLALAKDYGKSDLVYSGPIYTSSEIQGGTTELSFDHVGGGLVSSDGKELTHFTVAGENKEFEQATAVIKNGKILVSSDKVKKPKAVRFAWGSGDEPNLMNKEGLPASSFRTDEWPIKGK